MHLFEKNIEHFNKIFNEKHQYQINSTQKILNSESILHVTVFLKSVVFEVVFEDIKGSFKEKHQY